MKRYKKKQPTIHRGGWILHDFAQEFLLRNDGGKSSCVTVLHVAHKSLFTKVFLVKY